MGKIIPLLCDEIVAEYREVLARPKFKFDQKVVDVFIDGIIDRGIFVDAVPVEEIIPDPKDIVFYEVAMEGRKEYDAAYLVAGNRNADAAGATDKDGFMEVPDNAEIPFA